MFTFTLQSEILNLILFKRSCQVTTCTSVQWYRLLCCRYSLTGLPYFAAELQLLTAVSRRLLSWRLSPWQVVFFVFFFLPAEFSSPFIALLRILRRRQVVLSLVLQTIRFVQMSYLKLASRYVRVPTSHFSFPLEFVAPDHSMTLTTLALLA